MKRMLQDVLARLDALPASLLPGFHRRSLLLTRDFSTPEIEAVCEVAAVFQELDRAGRAVPLFPHELTASCRTRGAASRSTSRPRTTGGPSPW
jgi:hypothetical protein